MACKRLPLPLVVTVLLAICCTYQAAASRAVPKFTATEEPQPHVAHHWRKLAQNLGAAVAAAKSAGDAGPKSELLSEVTPALQHVGGSDTSSQELTNADQDFSYGELDGLDAQNLLNDNAEPDFFSSFGSEQAGFAAQADVGEQGLVQTTEANSILNAQQSNMLRGSSFVRR